MNTVSAFHRVVCCTWSLSRCLLCGLPRRWKLHVFKSLIFNVSQSIKACFFLSLTDSCSSLAFFQSFPLSRLSAPSIHQPDRPADSVGFSDGFKRVESFDD